MLEALLSSADGHILLEPQSYPPDPSFSSTFHQYLSLDPFLITGTTMAFYVGCARKKFYDLVLPLAVVSADNFFRKITDASYTFEHLGRDSKYEILFVLGAYLLGSLTGLVKKAYSHRRHTSQPS